MPLITGNSSARHASAKPSIACTIWPMISGLLRIAEIEIVGDRERTRADGGEIAPGFGDGLLAAFVGIGLDVARRHIARHRQRALASRRGA